MTITANFRQTHTNCSIVHNLGYKNAKLHVYIQENNVVKYDTYLNNSGASLSCTLAVGASIKVRGSFSQVTSDESGSHTVTNYTVAYFNPEVPHNLQTHDWCFTMPTYFFTVTLKW